MSITCAKLFIKVLVAYLENRYLLKYPRNNCLVKWL